MPAGRQQRELAVKQGEGARIAVRADDSRHPVVRRGAMGFGFVREKGLAVEARAFHHGDVTLQQRFRDPHDRAWQHADGRGVHLAKLADMGCGGRIQAGGRRTFGAAHHPCQYGGRVG